ncbi:ParA family protein [Lactobacillus sp. ESL0791]|uniref:ParA family protein n=1 Tax=Lactobacillus sp. ESL0791 TaxID=2983234 RepID=UPI0023F7965F|nr:ParA family protein [Lactobacillus sp. ESL0791]MDF7639935.1 ParA family protein [Lactobacillus sp. ESL0791]
MTEIITIANFKGGVSKTTTTVMFSYILNERQNKKVLCVDFDPQSNATEILNKTYPKPIRKAKTSFINGLKNMNLVPAISKLSENLDLLGADWDLSLFPEVADNFSKNKQYLILQALINKIKNQYDYILIDTPPTLSVFTNNAILASDYVVMVMQSQQQSFTSSIKFVSYLQQLRKDYSGKFDLLGIIPCLMKTTGTVDKEVLDEAKQTLGNAMLVNILYNRERVKRFGRSGIKNEDIWDSRTIYMYEMVLKELLRRIEERNK